MRAGLCCAAGIMLVLMAPAASARNFTYTYEATVAEQGELEYAQWATWGHHAADDHGLEQIDFRHELEYGVTDRWQLSLDLPDWQYRESDVEPDDHADFQDVAVESVYQLADPRRRRWGVALYGEARVGDEVISLEPKLIVQKNAGPWILAYNLALEAEWEGRHYAQDNGVLGQTLGVSRRLGASRWRAGLEVTHELEYADWQDWEKPLVYAGPNLTAHGREWWLGLTPTFQLSDNPEKPDTAVRVIAGFEFD